MIGAEAGLAYACGQRPKDYTLAQRKTHSNSELDSDGCDVILLGGGGRLVEFPLRQM